MRELKRGRVAIVMFVAPGVDYLANLVEKHPGWIERLFALGEFIAELTPGWQVALYPYEDEEICGLRIAEISLTKELGAGGMAGSSYMRNDRGAWPVLLQAEEFLASWGVKPVRPGGWESYLNPHGDARLNLMRAMGHDESAIQSEYQRQLAAEKALSCAN